MWIYFDCELRHTALVAYPYTMDRTSPAGVLKLYRSSLASEEFDTGMAAFLPLCSPPLQRVQMPSQTLDQE